MSDKLRGAFQGCPHHEDDYEACIQYSGGAPCDIGEERDRYSRLFSRACETLGAVQDGLTDFSRDMDQKLESFEDTQEVASALAAMELSGTYKYWSKEAEVHLLGQQLAMHEAKAKIDRLMRQLDEESVE